MPNNTKDAFLRELRERYGFVRKLEKSNSLFEVGDGGVRIYVRYSKIHRHHSTFYGLRKEDLQELQGRPSLICFLWEGQTDPLFLPYSDYEEVFGGLSPASDGQYKAQIYLQDGATELHLTKSGRFNLEGQFGWSFVDALLTATRSNMIPDFSHSQIQALLSSIGTVKGFDIWVPQADRGRVNESLPGRLTFRDVLPPGFEVVGDVLSEVDVVWLQRGSSRLTGLFEVEHSTPIYSALLRFNDILLSVPPAHQVFRIVANDMRRAVFARQLNRPTFRSSGLNELCTFLEYRNVFGWYERIKAGPALVHGRVSPPS
ncbi:MAG: hypothetical protein NTW03_16675 [Verrucomicrobia bacterium]|nr:hypothetical protein [Verrucomicrobiota bacterium]